jgi:hypothetical protein
MRDVADRRPVLAQALKSEVEAIAYRARTRARCGLRESGGRRCGFQARRLPGRADMVLRRSGSTNVMLVTLLIPVTAILLGYFVLGEGISPPQIIGAS